MFLAMLSEPKRILARTRPYEMNTQRSIKLNFAESSHGAASSAPFNHTYIPEETANSSARVNIASTPQQPWKTEPTSAEQQRLYLHSTAAACILGKTCGYMTLKQRLPGRSVMVL